MDLLKRVAQNRQERGLEMPQSIHSFPKPSTEVTRSIIIEKKPKHKVLKKYFEEIVQRAIDEDEL